MSTVINITVPPAEPVAIAITTPPAQPVTVTIGEARPGANGASAYQLAVAAGYQGTEAQWLASLSAQVTQEAVAGIIHAAAAATPADADEMPFWNALSSSLRKLSWANVKESLGVLFASSNHAHAQSDITGLAEQLSLIRFSPIIHGATGIAVPTPVNGGNAAIQPTTWRADSGTTAGGAAAVWIFGNAYQTPLLARGMSGVALNWSLRWRFAMKLCPRYARGAGGAKFVVGLAQGWTLPMILAGKGIGWTLDGTSLKGICHDGAALTTGSGGYTVAENVAVDVLLDYDGAGVLKLYVDDLLVDTVSGGPTGNAISTAGNLGVGAYSAAGGSANQSTVYVGDIRYLGG